MSSDNTSIKLNEQGLQLSGDLVYSTVSDVLDAGNPLLESYQGDTLKINCAELSRVDSAGIAVLIEWTRWCVNNQKKCIIEDIQNQAISLIETYKLKGALNLT